MDRKIVSRGNRVPPKWNIRRPSADQTAFPNQLIASKLLNTTLKMNCKPDKRVYIISSLVFYPTDNHGARLHTVQDSSLEHKLQKSNTFIVSSTQCYTHGPRDSSQVTLPGKFIHRHKPRSTLT